MRPEFVEVDEVLFLSPVEIGNLIRLDGCVLYTEPHSGTMHVEVIAKVSVSLVFAQRARGAQHTRTRTHTHAHMHTHTQPPTRGVLL